MGTLALARENSQMYQFARGWEGLWAIRLLMLNDKKTFLLHPLRAQPSGQGKCILLLYLIHFLSLPIYDRFNLNKFKIQFQSVGHFVG